jgi:secreted trypsin-like serine protease
MHARFIALLAIAFASGCGAAPDSEPTSQAGEEIVGGTVDTGHPAVADLYFSIISNSTAGLGIATCTGTLISPRVILSAGHCARPKDFSILGVKAYFGTQAASANDFTRPVIVWQAHPSYDQSVTSPYDIAVFVLASAVTGIAPLRINRGAIQTGQAVTLVGFGKASGSEAFALFPKRSVTTTIGQFDDVQFLYGHAGTTTCQGDSGGPELITVNGVQQIAGVTSAGPTPCESGSALAVRTDAHAAFIDQMVAQYNF